ncbi:MAG: SDR family oxidoreductase [Nitrospira sp.]|nr:SDR family oxidoreductase [Nitrospira sp.]
METKPPLQRIFLTGGTGYLGSRLIPLLAQRGHAIRALTRESSRTRLPAGCEPVIGNPFDARTFLEHVRRGDTFVQLVGTPRPAPWKGDQFRAVDRISGLASIEAARQTGVDHFIYVSVAHPAPIMKDYIAVRCECEAVLRAGDMPATILRPWYVLGPGHWWPFFLAPIYRIAERWPSTRKAAGRLGLLTIGEMLNAVVWAVEHPPEAMRVMDVPDIRLLAGGTQ